MTTRQAICDELRKRSYPQTAEMLREKIGKTTVAFLCRCLALERNIVERKVRGQFWYAWRPSQFHDYRIEYETGAHRGHNWKVLCYQPSERGATMLAAHAAKGDPERVYRVIYRSEFIKASFNDSKQKELESWREGKRALRALRSHLRRKASTPEHSSPA